MDSSQFTKAVSDFVEAIGKANKYICAETELLLSYREKLIVAGDELLALEPEVFKCMEDPDNAVISPAEMLDYYRYAESYLKKVLEINVKTKDFTTSVMPQIQLKSLGFLQAYKDIEKSHLSSYGEKILELVRHNEEDAVNNAKGMIDLMISFQSPDSDAIFMDVLHELVDDLVNRGNEGKESYLPVIRLMANAISKNHKSMECFLDQLGRAVIGILSYSECYNECHAEEAKKKRKIGMDMLNLDLFGRRSTSYDPETMIYDPKLKASWLIKRAKIIDRFS